MKYYDFVKAKNYIESNKENLLEVSLGMHEDWFWTAQAIWENGEYKKELFLGDMLAEVEKYNKRCSERFESNETIFDIYEVFDYLLMGGLCGSSWATPVMEVEFKDGTNKTINCFIGESEKAQPPELMLGELSAPVQDARSHIDIENIES